MTDLVPAALIATALTAYETLWNMIFDENGQPVNVEAADALLAIYDNMKAVVSHNQQLAAEIEGMAETLKDLRAQRNQLAKDVERDGARITRITRKEIAHSMGYEMLSDYSNVVAEDLLSVLTGDNDPGLSAYTVNRLKDALEYAAEEIAAIYEETAEEMEEDDND
jgi:DNA repair ATPase RecN